MSIIWKGQIGNLSVFNDDMICATAYLILKCLSEGLLLGILKLKRGSLIHEEIEVPGGQGLALEPAKESESPP